MAKTLVTGGTGFIGSHVVRGLARRGDELRLLAREGRDLSHLDGIEFERVTGDVCDRDSIRAAMRGVERVFHVAGKTSMRASDRDRVFEINVGGTRNVMEEALRAGVLRVVHTSSVGAVGPAEPGGTADEDQLFTAGGLGIAYINSKHEAELTAMRVAAHGLPVVIVNPAFVLGPDDPTGTSNALVRRLLLRRIPAYVDGALSIVDVRDVARGHLLADERGLEGERYILSGRNFTLQRLFADIGRIAGVPPPAVKLPGKAMVAAAEAMEKAGAPTISSSDEVKSGLQWWTYRHDKARRELGFEPRPHEETLEDTVRWQLDQLGDRVKGHQLADAALRVTGSAMRLVPFGGVPVSDPAPAPKPAPGADRRVLYRCRTPTNFLCPCGAVERRLRKLGVEHRTERVPFRKADRPEIVELTRQRRVPVLVDGDEVINDSRRILQYLDWAFGEDSR